MTLRTRAAPGRKRAVALTWAGLGLSVTAAMLAASCFSGTADPEPEPEGDADCAELSAATFGDSTGEDHYRVVYPDGGESFRVGDTLKVVITSGSGDSEGLVDLVLFKDGLSTTVPMPGRPRNAIDPRKDCTWRFVIPDSAALSGRSISLVSDSVKIRLSKYNQVSTVFDYSDGFFRIVPR